MLKQTFTNPSSEEDIKECIYTFPLYDGVSVVSFTCRIGTKILRGLVKEKVKAKKIFDEAVAKGETAGLLEQAPEASDVFSTKLGNIPAGESVVVEITYIGELKHHETDGIRFTIPTSIAPRYGSVSNTAVSYGNLPVHDKEGIKITVDVNMPEGSFIKGVQSPSHPIAVSMGTVSTAIEADPLMSKASATLSLGSAALEKDFVLVVQVKDIGTPKAILESHPTIPNQRALMATLVPKFSLPPSRPEIVFVADRSGSMGGNIEMLVSAMKVFLKSMPVGVKFNICSFGSSCSFLWPKSKAYTAETVAESTVHLQSFSANMGGTETFKAIKETVDRRFTDLPLEIMLLTDGDIWQQQELFTYVNEQVTQSDGAIRVFPLGIGNGVSHALIEGLARAGNGFAQSVQHGERLDNSVVRMLRGALSPHITDYTLEVKYDQEDDDFEVIERVTESMKVLLSDSEKTIKPLGAHRISPQQTPQQTPQQRLEQGKPQQQATISLFDSNVNPEKDDIKMGDVELALPEVPSPKLLQAPHKIPTLFAFSRTVVYLLMSPDTVQRKPTAVVLRATSSHGPLALEIPVEVLSSPAETVHQLAAKKAVQDLEEGRGWIYDAKDEAGILIKDRFPSCFDDLVKREAVRLGEKFQVAGKWCSFVAVSANDEEIARKRERMEVSDLEEGESSHQKDDKLQFLNTANADVLTDLIDYSDDEFHVVGRPTTPTQADEKRARNAGASARFRKRRQISSASPQPQPSSLPANTAGSNPFFPSASTTMASGQSLGYSPTSPGFSPASPGSSSASNYPMGRVMFRRSKELPDPHYSRSSSAASVSDGFAAAEGQEVKPKARRLGAKEGAAQYPLLQQPQHMPLQPTGFGASQPTGGRGSSMFGGRGGPQGLFGQPTASPSFGPVSTSQASLFGNSQSPLNGSGTGGLFGSAPRAPASSPFASQSPSSNGGGTSSLFGGMTASQNAQPASANNFGSPGYPAPQYRCSPTHQSRQYYGPSAQAFTLHYSQNEKPETQEAQGLSKPSQVDWMSKSAAEKVLALIALQDFEGSWPDDNTEVEQIMGFEICRCPNMGDQKTWVTLVVVCFLEQKMGNEEGTWGLVVEKARGWLEGLENMDLENLEKSAKELVMKY